MLAPPFIVSTQEIDEIVARFGTALERTLSSLAVRRPMSQDHLHLRQRRPGRVSPPSSTPRSSGCAPRRVGTIRSRSRARRWTTADQPLVDRSPIDTAVVLGRFAAARAAEVDRAVARRAGRQPAWARRSWRERIAVLRRAAALIRERKYELAALMSLEVGQEPARGDGRRGGVRRPDRLLLRAGGGRRRVRPRDGADHRRRAEHGRAPAVRRLRLHRAVQLSRSRSRPGCRRPRWSPATPWSTSRRRTRPGPGSGSTRSTATPDCRPACSTLVGRGAEDIGDALWQHPGVDGVVFTGSKAVGLRIHAGISTRWIKPCLLELGGKNAAIVTAERRSRRRRGRRDALGVQPAEPEVQRDLAGCTSTASRGGAVRRAAAREDPRP